MFANVKMTLLLNGEPMHKPRLLTLSRLRETLLQVCEYDVAKVNRICQAVEEQGLCRIGETHGSIFFEIKKVLAS